jgi:hypothetical protein
MKTSVKEKNNMAIPKSVKMISVLRMTVGTKSNP